MRLGKTPLTAALHGLVPAARDSAHAIDVPGGSPTRAYAPECPPAAPRPRANRLLGFALELRRNQLRTYERAMREYGDVVRLVVGPPGLRFELTCVFHPDGVQRVLAGSREGYSKETPGYREITAAIGRGLLTSEGQLWRRQRRLIQPLFTRKQIATYATLMAEEAARTADRWERATGQRGTVDAQGEMMRLTLRVVGQAIFGADVEHAIHVIRRTFPVLTRHMLRRTLAPVAPPAAWPTPANLRAARAQSALFALVDDLIARRRRAGLGGEDLLSRLLDARDAETGRAMEIQQVRDEALIFLLAGHETTVSALTFALQLLGRHPDEQQRVADELADVLGGRPPTVEDVPALRRTAMVLKEGCVCIRRSTPLPDAPSARTRSAAVASQSARSSSSASGPRTDTHASGTTPRRSTPTASTPSRRPRGTATPTFRSAPDRAPASARSSPCRRHK
jgi:cytochrome P450